MRNMFKLMGEKLSSGQDMVMVSVIASSGSTPRGAGARMLVTAEGRLCGTIGGGAVEYRSEQIAAEVLKEKRSGLQDFSLTRDDVQNLGMICGGAVKVFFRFIPAGDQATLRLCKRAEELFKLGRDLWLISDIGKGGSLSLYTRQEGFFGLENPPRWLSAAMTGHPARIEQDGQDFYLEQINSSGRVYVFGCGHVAQELVPVLSRVGFRCVALDDRPSFANAALFPAAEEVKIVDFEKLDDYVNITSEDYCCIMTRGHAYDAVVQAQLLKTPACYIGVIGSRAKKAGVFKKLSEEYGYTETDFKRITTPIGLEIKAETPAEIAVSIAAQLIEIRAERNEK